MANRISSLTTCPLVLVDVPSLPNSFSSAELYIAMRVFGMAMRVEVPSLPDCEPVQDHHRHGQLMEQRRDEHLPHSVV